MGSKLIETKYLILGPSFGNDEIELRKIAAGLTKVLKIYISSGGDQIPILGSSIPNAPDKTISATPEDWQFEYITDSIRRVSEFIDLRLEITTNKNEADFEIVINPYPEQDYLSSTYRDGIKGLISISHQTGFVGYEYQGKIVENLVHTNETKKTQKIYFLHEFGHLLGLEHPVDFNDSDGINNYYPSDFTYQKNESFPYEFTVMGWNGNHDEEYSLKDLWFTEADIRALKEIWGSYNEVLKNMTIANEYFLPGIKDYDGNLHANTGNVSDNIKISYKYQGLVDVNADGTKEAIYTNKESGRWVTASINSSTGEIDYSDHGEGGTTRIVGIYEDPLIVEGSNNGGFLSDGVTPAPANFGVSDEERYVVVNGETIDRLALNSQVRFQNDLKIDNLSVKTSGDFDSDGVNEVYWKTNDGTAYLRALMHDDGNIRYANYQSKEQMSEYLINQGHTEIISDIV